MSRFGLMCFLCLLALGCSDKQKEADRLAADMKALQKKTGDSTRDTLTRELEDSVKGAPAASDDLVSDTTPIAPGSIPGSSNRETARSEPDTQSVEVENADVVQPPSETPSTETAETPASVEPIMPPRPVDDGYVVQIASTVNPNEAKEIVARFAGFGYPAFPQAAQVDGTVWYRVRVGPYPTSREASAVLTELNEKYQISGWIARHR